MKKILMILLVAVLCCCQRTICEEAEYRYIINNESDYTLLIEAKSFEPLFPELLTLNPGDTFSWEGNYMDLVTPSTFRITFDGKYTIDQSSFAKHRNPRDIKNYNTIKRGKWLVTHTYTFTNEDYEIAKQQKKNPE